MGLSAQADCSISGVEAEPFSCTGEGTYALSVSFAYDNVSGDGFFVIVDGEEYGPFDYGNLPVTVEDIPGFGALPVTVVVQDAAHPDCHDFTIIDPVDCSDLCLDFDDIEPGTIWGSSAGNEPGDVVYEAEDVLMSVHGLILPAGPDVFGNVLFDQAPVSQPLDPLSGIVGLASNINLGFDFTQLDHPVAALRIGFGYFGGVNNISINGGDLIQFESFAELPDLLPNVHVVMLPNTTDEIGYLFVYGVPIETFVLGGQELAFDNLCLYLDNVAPACGISNLEVEQLPCQADGQFYVSLSFDHENTGNFGFSVHGNGMDYGIFSYDDLPVFIGPLTGDGSMIFEFAVQDVEFPDCGDAIDFGTVNCSDQCVEMEELEVGTVFGVASGMQAGDVAFVEDDVSVSVDSFMYFNGDMAFLNATIDDGSFGPPGNPLTGNYAFVSNINLVFDFTGLAEPVTSVSFGFVDGGGEENFAINDGELFVLNNFYELPLQNIPGFTIHVLPAPDVSDVSGYVIIEGHVETLTIGGQELGLDNICSVTAEPCTIAGLEAEFIEATDDGLLYQINFEAANTSQTHFDLFFNGEFVGFYSLDDLPLQLLLPCGDLPEGEITVCMNDTPDCCASITVDMSACLPCDLHDLVVEPGPCENGLFMLDVDFQHDGQGGHFKIKADGNIYGPYSYADLPVTIGPFLGDSTTVYPILIRDTEDPQCKLVGSFGPVDCEIDCVLYEVELDYIESGGEFLVYQLDLTAVNPLSDQFEVHFNGEFVGVFSYADLPVVLELPCSDLPEGELTICDADGASCCVSVPVDMTHCQDCHIGELIVEPHDCDGSGNFLFDLDFPHQNGAAGGFKVVVNGQSMGVYGYGELPLTLGPLAGDATTIYHIVVRDLEDPSCIQDADFGPVDCNEPCGPPVYVEVIGEGDNGILVLIGSTGDITGALDVYVNDIFLGTFDNLPAEPIVQEIPCNLPSPILLTVCYHETPDCCTAIELELPACADCHISNVEAVHTPCNADGFFEVNLNFDYMNVGDQFKVVGNGTNYGLFSYADLPITLGPFEGDGTTVYEFIVTDVADPNCSGYTEIGPVDCNTECSIYDLTAVPGDCNGDGTYNLTIDFNYQNPGNDFFDLYLNGVLYDYYLLSALPLTIEGLVPSSNVVHVLVCINDVPNCCEDTNYETPSCVVFEEIWPGDANHNGEADYDDLLSIGLAYGEEGPQRPLQGIDWSAHVGPNWPQVFVTNSLNYKFADCNGDGIINEGDVEAIEQNYGLSYAEPVPVPSQEATQNDPPIYLSLPPSIPNGPFEAEVMLGTEDLPVDGIYGLSFKVQFDPQVVMANSIDITFDNSWLAAGGEVLSIDRTLEAEGLIEIAVTRIDHTNVSGYGAMANFIGIIDDVLGKGEMQLNIIDVHALRADESPIPLYKLPAQVEIPTSVHTPSPADGIKVFPNPTSDWLYFDLPKGVEIQRVRIYDAQGRLQLVSFDGKRIDLGHLPKSMYFLQIETKAGEIVYRKVLH